MSHPLAPFGVPFGSLWGALGLPLAILWGPFGQRAELGIWTSVGDSSASQWLSSTMPAHKIKPPGILAGFPGFPGSPGSRRSGGTKCC